MGYEPDDGGIFAKTSGKKLAIMFGLVFAGAILFIQIIQGFPLRDILVREKITEVRPILLKQGSICVVDTPDHPRNIDNCPYSIGDKVQITYFKNKPGIESHRLAS